LAEAKFCMLCGNALTEKMIDGKNRRACSSRDCGHVLWDNPVPVVTAIIKHEDRIVLARNRIWPEKMFGLITGFLEKGEEPEQGIIREIREELGLEGRITEFIGLYSLFQVNQLLIAYEVETSGEIITGDEIAEIKRVEPSRLKPWPFGTGLVVKDWLIKKGIIVN
jgi:NAD+ diphosphatase